MISNVSRFYQMGAAALMEYVFNTRYSDTDPGEWGKRNISAYKPFVFNLADGTRLVADTASSASFPSGNNVRGISIPYDSGATVMFRLTDPSTGYMDYVSAMETLGSSDCGVLFDTDTESYPFDLVRIYFVGGYFLNDLEAMDIDISVQSEDGVKTSLSHIFFDRSGNLKYEYLETPLVVSGRIYDKYIWVRVPAVRYMCAPLNASGGGDISGIPYAQDGLYRRMSDAGLDPSGKASAVTFPSYLRISQATAVRVEYSAITTDSVYEYSTVDAGVFDVIGSLNDRPSISDGAVVYSRGSVTSCALPQTANSDGITAEIKVVDDHIEFGGMWRGEPITGDVVRRFNREFPLYDVRLKNNANLYDAGADNTGTWIGYHEVTAVFYDSSDNEITDSYDPVPAYTQTFTFVQRYGDRTTGDGLVKYRPVIEKNHDLTHVEFVYNYRLVNTIDDVQFLRTASVAYDGNISDFFSGTTRIRFVDASGEPITPARYNVYNRVERIEQKIEGGQQMPTSTMYTKVFYDSSDITLDVDGSYYGGGTYTLKVSEAPKNYKFSFRRYDQAGTLTVFDMSGSSYRLYSRDAAGEDILVDPTYSSNMNLVLGEVEFNLTSSVILRLKGVEADKRFMSVVVVNTDGSVSSMFDFTYE